MHGSSYSPCCNLHLLSPVLATTSACCRPCACPPAGILFCPESPAWLVLKGLRREASSVAEQLWGPDGAVQLGAGAAGGWW